MEFGIYHH